MTEVYLRFNELIDAEYIPVAFSDHLTFVIKIKMPNDCINAKCPRATQHFKAKPEIIKDRIFKARLEEKFVIWDDAVRRI